MIGKNIRSGLIQSSKPQVMKPKWWPCAFQEQICCALNYRNRGVNPWTTAVGLTEVDEHLNRAASCAFISSSPMQNRENGDKRKNTSLLTLSALCFSAKRARTCWPRIDEHYKNSYKV